MKRWSFLLKPGWWALGLVVVAFAYLCFTVLAPWQLGKNTKTERENQQIQSSLTAAPVPVKTFLPQQNSSARDAQWRQVTATGRYLTDAQVVARLRLVGGEPAYEVLVPFAVDGGPTVLVDRGYLRPVQGTAVPAIPPAPGGTVSITARLRDSETAPPDKPAFTENGVTQVYAIDTRAVSAATRIPLAGSYLQLTENQPGVLGVAELPHLDAGPFLSYGIQWIAFGIVAPIGLGYFIYSEVKARRRDAEASSAAATTPSAPVTVEDKLADRYGRRR